MHSGKRPLEYRETTLEGMMMDYGFLLRIAESITAMDDNDLVMALETGHSIKPDPGLVATARRESDKARVRWESAKTRKDKRQGAEDLEFWTSRAAFLGSDKPLVAIVADESNVLKPTDRIQIGTITTPAPDDLD